MAKVPGSNWPCENIGETACYGVLAVLRLSLGLCMFHSFFMFLTLGISSSRDPRAALHNGMWAIKLLLLAGAIVGCFWIPAKNLSQYDIVAFVGGFIFVLIQLVLLVDFAHKWSEKWISNYEDSNNKFWVVALTVCTVLMFIAAFVLTVLMYVYFLPGRSECGLNTFFITMNMILCVIASIVSIHPRVQDANPRSGILQASVITIYSTYLVYSALLSEPTDINGSFFCNRMPSTESSERVGKVIGVIFTVIAILCSALSVSNSRDTLSGSSESDHSAGASVNEKVLINAEKGEPDEGSADDGEEAEGTVYSYSFFHFSFAVAAMYVGVMLTGWQFLKEDPSNTGLYALESSLAAVWVKMASSWCAVCLYLWTLLAPICLSNRSFS